MKCVLYLVFLCIASNNTSEGRSVQAIIGRNVSFSFTLPNATKDAVKILHDTSLLLFLWPNTTHYVVPEKRERVRFSEHTYAGETVILNITLLNITKEDVGTYTVAWQRNSKNDFNDSIVLQTVDEDMIPRIDIVRYITSDSSLVLQCFSSSSFAGKFIWKLNASLIENHSRYSQKDDCLTIGNVTADDQYNSYTCMNHESELESDPYRVRSSGPSVIKFTPNVPLIIEHHSVHISCNSDCSPICTWQWTKYDPLSDLVETVSSENILLITNITRRDAERYTCKVQNVLSGAVNASQLSLDVIYGPDELLLNTSNTIIEMDEFDSITLSCFADCFPPCQISWSASDIEIPGAVLRLNKQTDGSNFTCYARNARNSNTMISNTISIKVKSATAARVVILKSVSGQAITYYMTTSKSKEDDTDANAVSTNRLLMYILLGLGAMFAIGFFTCILQKILKCLRVDEVPNNIPLQYSGEGNPPEGYPPESYWTIVSNAKGELSTALETSTNEINELTPICNETVADVNQLEESSQLLRIEADLELDGYIHPIH